MRLAAARWTILSLGVVGFLSLQNGCATFGRREAAEQVAAGRDLARQGIAAKEAGQWQRSEDLLRQAVEVLPDDSDAHHQLAETLWHRGATQDARSHIADAVRLDPSNAVLAVRAGEMALAVGAHDEALSRTEHAIRQDPKLAAAWALRGRTFLRLSQPDRANADLQRALELGPENRDVLLEMTILHRQRGESARALAALHNLLDSYPPGEEPQIALMLEGQMLMALGRPHQAVESLLAASHRGPPNAELCFLLAQAQSNAGRLAEATAAAEQALAIDTSHAPSRQLLAQLAGSTPGAEPQTR